MNGVRSSGPSWGRVSDKEKERTWQTYGVNIGPPSEAAGKDSMDDGGHEDVAGGDGGKDEGEDGAEESDSGGGGVAEAEAETETGSRRL